MKLAKIRGVSLGLGYLIIQNVLSTLHTVLKPRSLAKKYKGIFSYLVKRYITLDYPPQMARLHICLHETANRAIAKASYTQRLQKSGQTLGCSFRFRGQNCVFQGGTGSLSLFSVAPDFLLRLACNMPPTPQVKKMTSCNIKVMLL